MYLSHSQEDVGCYGYCERRPALQTLRYQSASAPQSGSATTALIPAGTLDKFEKKAGKDVKLGRTLVFGAFENTLDLEGWLVPTTRSWSRINREPVRRRRMNIAAKSGISS
jgi:hypothetical protein